METPRCPFDPLVRSSEVEAAVMRGSRRKYYRFRGARYYGGIATADAVGCCFLCAYCWNYRRNSDPAASDGLFLSPAQASARLLKIMRQRSFNKVRITGAEPILGTSSFYHLLQVIDAVASRWQMVDFIVETNGLVLGHEPGLVEQLAARRRIFVRVSLKGWDEGSFERITGARGEFFRVPIMALRRLLDAGVSAWPAVMYEVFGAGGIERLCSALRQERIAPEELEVEYLECYPAVLENMKKRQVELKAEPRLFEPS